MRPLPCFSTKVYHDTSILSHILRLQALPTQTCMGSQHRQHPCFPTSCHLQRRHHRQQTANRFKWSRCWEVAVLTMLVTHTMRADFPPPAHREGDDGQEIVRVPEQMPPVARIVHIRLAEGASFR